MNNVFSQHLRECLIVWKEGNYAACSGEINIVIVLKILYIFLKDQQIDKVGLSINIC